MTVLAFDESVRRQIRNVIGYAKQHIYEVDDILDMMNDQKVTPGEKPGHLVLAPIGRWICYYLVDHPQHGRCHYFSFKPYVWGKLPDRPEMEYILREFGIESPLLDQHITIDKTGEEVKIILPVASRSSPQV